MLCLFFSLKFQQCQRLMVKFEWLFHSHDIRGLFQVKKKQLCKLSSNNETYTENKFCWWDKIIKAKYFDRVIDKVCCSIGEFIEAAVARQLLYIPSKLQKKKTKSHHNKIIACIKFYKGEKFFHCEKSIII